MYVKNQKLGYVPNPPSSPIAYSSKDLVTMLIINL
jgi:hypothetical protein